MRRHKRGQVKGEAPHRLSESVKSEDSLMSPRKSAHSGYGLPIADYKSIFFPVSPICEPLALFPEDNANDE
jgi:hypothetical protein